MWRPRDRERYIGAYDPEHEMPDPDRHPGERWQSDAYRRGARDSRFAYRLNPNAFENRYDGPRRDVDSERNARWQGDARDREAYERGYRAGYYDRHAELDRGWDRNFDRERELDRGSFMTGPHYDRDRGHGYGASADRGWDRDDFNRGPRRR